MFALIINLINVLFLTYLVCYYIKYRIDTSLLWYSIVSLFFINIPLLFDNCLLYYDIDLFNNIQLNSNVYWELNFVSDFLRVSLCSLMFNLCFFLSYRFITRKKIFTFIFLESNKKASILFPWIIYFLVSYFGLLLFMYHNNISSFSFIGTGLWYQNRNDNAVINLLVNLLVPIMPVSLFVSLVFRKYLLGFLCIIPVILIAIITGARSQYITIAFYLLYYIIWKLGLKQFSFNSLIKLFIVSVSIAVFIMSLRSESNTYPLSKDLSYCDLFYVFQNSNAFTTEGTNFIRLILTGFYDYSVNDVTAELANYKFFQGWGTLHPTLLGWAYADLQGYFWVLSLFFGTFLGFYDLLRHSILYKYNIFFLAFLFSFISISVRGSVQYAYSTIIYPFFILVLFYTYIKKKRNENNISS